jgi:sugar phosphate isomerase/epimerase
VFAAITSVRQNYGGVITEVAVGVPSAFVSIVTKGHTISFPSKRKLSAQDVDALYDSGLNELAINGRCTRRSNMYFTLGDNRKYFKAEDLYGVPTTLLKGALCYYFIDETFYETVVAVLKELGIEEVKFIPSTLAQSRYLLTEKKREGYAFLLDIGFLTTSISVLYGNGIVREETLRDYNYIELNSVNETERETEQPVLIKKVSTTVIEDDKVVLQVTEEQREVLPVVEEVRKQNMSFLQAVRNGAFTVPGDGDVDFDPIFKVLADAGYKGWLLVEAEQDPAKANPLEYAMKGRAYIREHTGL